LIPARYRYSAYGFSIDSALPLPELAIATGDGDLSVIIERIGTIDPLDEPGHRLADDSFLFWNLSGRYLVRDGREIVVDPAEDADEGIVRAQILGIALPVLLHQRGALVLHASAIAMHGRAVGFAGVSHAGKSTTAAIFFAHGYPLLSDDIIAVEFVDGVPMVAPGFPYVKIWPDSVSAVGRQNEHLPRFIESGEKRVLHTGDVDSDRRTPLGRLYLLDRESNGGVVPLGKHDALRELMAHTFVSSLLKTPSSAARHLAQCAELLRSIPVSRIGTMGLLGSLSTIVGIVEEDVGGEGNG
jgi:hypothetical protein